MPKKIKSVKKLRSSKAKSHGMISREELRDILHEEEWKELQPRIDLVNAQIKIEELQAQIDNPDYYDDRGNNYSPTFHGQLEEIQMKSDNADKLIHEMDSISAYFMGALTVVSGLAMLGFILALIVV